VEVWRSYEESMRERNMFITRSKRDEGAKRKI